MSKGGNIMSELTGKIDFTLFIGVSNANPNGDPLNGNRPRIDLDGYGEISDVCIKTVSYTHLTLPTN